MNTVFRKSTAVFLLTVFALTAAVGGAAAFQQYKDYREKMNILYTMAGTESVQNQIIGKREAGGNAEAAGAAENGDSRAMSSFRADACLDAAAGLLKGKTQNAEIGRKLLSDYGYTDEFQLPGKNRNYYLSELYTSWAMTASICFIAYLAVSGLWLYQSRRCRREYLSHLYGVSAVLSDLQAGEYDSLRRDAISGDDEASDVLYDRLVSYSEYLRYVRETSFREKESTKSLVTDLSHQLKTPVAALGTCLEILKQDGLTDGERREFTERCLAQKERLSELLSALFHISRLESGMIEIHNVRARIFDTVAAAVSRIYPVAEQKKIEISMEAEEEIHNLEMSHDTKWLCEAFLNVLENGVKYSPEKSEIRIRMSKRITFLRIEIEDEGIGIPKEERHRVFQRFYRGIADEVVSQSGSGVGLYLTRQIIERHGGTIRVASGKKGGSVFVIQLPYAAENMEKQMHSEISHFKAERIS